MATKIQTITEVDFLEDGRVRGTLRIEWDESGVIDPEDTQMKNKTWDDYASTPQKLKTFITGIMNG